MFAPLTIILQKAKNQNFPIDKTPLILAGRNRTETTFNLVIA